LTNNQIPSLYRLGQNTPDRRILDRVTRDFSWQRSADDDRNQQWETLLSREWLVTNGLGGYASGTVSGAPTRRFHGVLIAALPAPHGRTMMLNDVSEEILLSGGEKYDLGGEETVTGVSNFRAVSHLQAFRLEAGLPVWIYNFDDRVLEKRIHLVNRQNTAHVTYVWRGADVVTLRIRPAVYFRPHEGTLGGLDPQKYSAKACGNWLEISNGSDLPCLRVALSRDDVTVDQDAKKLPDLRFRTEESRGYDYQGDLWSPGCFEVKLGPNQRVTLIASTEDCDVLDALDSE
jgi:predicted glycogen debranching enzyme